LNLGQNSNLHPSFRKEFFCLLSSLNQYWVSAWFGGVRTTGWFWLVKTKLELGLIFGPEFRTGTKVSIFSKTQNQTKPKLGSWFFKELELELEPASGILKTN
jgi:hypothetical protein